MSLVEAVSKGVFLFFFGVFYFGILHGRQRRSYFLATVARKALSFSLEQSII